MSEEIDVLGINRKLKVYEILKKENVDKIFKDNKGDVWKVATHIENLVLVLVNDGANRVSYN